MKRRWPTRKEEHLEAVEIAARAEDRYRRSLPVLEAHRKRWIARTEAVIKRQG